MILGAWARAYFRNRTAWILNLFGYRLKCLIISAQLHFWEEIGYMLQKQLQCRTTVEARKLIWSECPLNESVGMLCSHQNGMGKQIPQRMDHSKEHLMKNKIKSLHWTSKKCFWSPELYLMVLWGTGRRLLFPQPTRSLWPLCQGNPIILSRVAWQQLVLKSWTGFFPIFFPYFCTGEILYLFWSEIIASRFSYFQLCCWNNHEISLKDVKIYFDM